MAELIPEIAQRLQGAADQVEAQIPELMEQAEGLERARQTLAQALVGANEDNQSIHHKLGVAAEKTLEAAVALDELRDKIGAYVGRIAGNANSPSIPSVEENPSPAHTDEPAPTKHNPGKWPDLRYPRPSSEQMSKDPRAVALRREMNLKAYLIRKTRQGAEPSTAQGVQTLTDFAELQMRLNEQTDDNSPLRNLVDEKIADPNTDPFELQDKAKAAVDMLIGDHQDLDLVDTLAALYTFTAVHCDQLEKTSTAEGLRGDDSLSDRINPFISAVQQEIVSRIPLQNLGSVQEVSLQDLNDRLFKDIWERRPDWHELVRVHVDKMQEIIVDRASLGEVLAAGLSSADIVPKNDYNRPMDPQERERLNEAAAATIEGIHIMKGHGITPMIVPGESVGLPWDIAVVEPLDKNFGYQEEGALADFILLPPNQEHRHPTIKRTQIGDHPNQTMLSVGGGSHMRFRLHDDGQITHGLAVHNVPSDITERQFRQLQAGDGYERLRALLISMTFDAVVPADVVNNETGGSVARQYNRRPPSSERLVDIVLQRQRTLERAQVSPQNRQPTGWEWPTQIIGGHTRRLPEGYKPRPTAAEEARAYYNSMKIPFDGLPKGKTFVPEYKRGTGPERTTFRRAKFRRKSKTGQFLHNERNRSQQNTND